MKKTLVALATLAATGAFAQVTVYGNVDIAFGTAVTRAANGQQDKTSGVVDGTQMPNRIGFRGVEDLGNGLTAGFVLEQGISPSSSNGWNTRVATSGHQVNSAGGSLSSATMRAGNLFVSGGFGELRLGTMNRAAYNIASKTIVLAESYGGEGHTLAATRTTAISYTSPAMSGITGQFQYGAPHGARTTMESVADTAAGLRIDNTRVMGLSVAYNQGPLFAGVAYETTNILRVANAAASTNQYGGAVAVGTALDRAEQLWTAAVTYDFGIAKVNYSYVNRDQNAGGKANSSNLSATYPMGNIELAALATWQDGQTQAGVANSEIRGFQVGAKYNLSKRSNIYLFHGKDNDTLAAATAQVDRTRTVVGVQHSF